MVAWAPTVTSSCRTLNFLGSTCLTRTRHHLMDCTCPEAVCKRTMNPPVFSANTQGPSLSLAGKLRNRCSKTPRRPEVVMRLSWCSSSIHDPRSWTPYTWLSGIVLIPGPQTTVRTAPDPSISDEAQNAGRCNPLLGCFLMIFGRVTSKLVIRPFSGDPNSKFFTWQSWGWLLEL